MRRRLRPAYTDADMVEVYPQAYDHTRWPDHIDRVQRTIEFAARVFPVAESVADLSCGDRAIPESLARRWSARCTLGDFVPGCEYTGRVESTITQIPPVDVYICSETIEHIDDPDALLVAIRAKAQRLILSTPCDETITNPEHYWRWGVADLADMFSDTGWQPVAFEFLDNPDLDVRYQLWACR